jgi:hypothetical protein
MTHLDGYFQEAVGKHLFTDIQSMRVIEKLLRRVNCNKLIYDLTQYFVQLHASLKNPY